MKKIFLVGMIVSMSFISLYADGAREIYFAKISMDDKYNSRGGRLDSVSSILRQDRANYHKFHIRDRGDTSDNFFYYKSNRAKLSRMLRNGYISRGTRDAILYGNPLLIVKIYRNSIEVEVR